MKKVVITVLLIAIVGLLTCSAVNAKEESIKYVPYECDLFAVKYQIPDGWNVKVESDHIIMTHPTDTNLQLVFLEDKLFEEPLEQYITSYEEEIKQDNKFKISEKKAMEVAGYGAYYIKINTPQKDIGHVILIRDKKPIILVLKTKKGEYAKHEPVLKKMIETIKFVKPKS